MIEQYPFNEVDARQFYHWLRHKRGEFTEVRVIEWNPSARGKTASFFVSNGDDFLKVCREWNGKRQVYAGINPRGGQSGKADDVVRITGFPFDVDPPAPKHSAATDAEVKVAEGWANDVVEKIRKQFGIEPYMDFSGNGFRVALPCDIRIKDQQVIDAKLKLFFEEYKQQLQLPNFDNISDLPRIIKVPGTWSLKGTPTEQRPHRQAKLIQLGDTSEDAIHNVTEHILSLKAPEKKETQIQKQTTTEFSAVKLRQLRPCFLDFITNPQRSRMSLDKRKDSRNTETGLRKAFVLEMYFAGFSREKILDACKKFDDFNWDKSWSEINDVLDNLTEKTKPWTCKSIHKNGGCLSANCPIYFRKVKPEETEKKESQADRLVSLCISQEAEFFHDQHKTPYICVRQKDVNVIMPIRSRQFKTYLANLMWQTEQKVLGNEGLNSALLVLQGKALLEGRQYTLYNRVAPAKDGFWIDMTDNKWRAIKVDTEGWRIVKNPPILFKRYSHQLPLTEPTPGGNPWLLLEYFNIKKDDYDTRLTLMTSCSSIYIPLIAHVIWLLFGIQGSGKTLLFKILRRLFDPSSIEVLSMPRDEREHVQQLDHHWLALYDNITSMPTWISDRLCRATTGGGFSKRELYSDDEDITYNFKRCIGLNGINITAQRGDLLDRSLLIPLEHIKNEERKTEAKLLADFEKNKASILGGFLDTLVKAIQLYPTVKTNYLFRMADFTRWGCAIAKALDKTEEEFIAAYDNKVKSQIEEAAHASLLATVLLDFLEKESTPSLEKWQGWEGTPTALYKALFEHAKTLEISTRQKGFPKAPNALMRQLNDLAPSLKALGWEVVTMKSGIRRIYINTVQTAQPPRPSTLLKEMDYGDDKDDKDDISHSSSGGNNIQTGISDCEQRQGVAYISHTKTSEQCYNGCPLLAEWTIRIEPGFKQQFCNDCFNKAKRDLESNGYTVKFTEAQQQ
jgi:hypothetical protein